jgi:nitrous oxidase accessory protein NosD
LAAAGLAQEVAAGVAGDRLTLTTIGPPIEAVLRLRAAADDPILSEVHFADGQLATDSVTQHTFIEQAAVEASAEIAAAGIDATGRFGYLGVAVTDAAAAADVSVGVALKAPGAGTIGGRVYLTELYAGLGQDLGDLAAAPAVSGSAAATLPLQVTPNILGASHPANPHLVLAWPDIADANSLDVRAVGADLLLDFTAWDDAAVTAALAGVASYLADAEGHSLLARKLPGLNRSLGEITGYTERFQSSVSGLESRPAGVLQDLEARLRDIFGLDDAATEVSLAESNTVLRMTMTLEDTVQTGLPLDLDLDDLGIEGLSHLIDFRGSAQLAVEAGVLFQLDLGIDLTDQEDPRPFLYETTALGLTAKVVGQDLHFTTALGPLGVWIKSGSLLVDGDGSAATPDDAVLLGLTLDDGSAASNKIYLDALSLDHIRLDLLGQVHASLPLYAPTENGYLGDIALVITDLGDLEGTTALTAPDLENLFGDFDLINNLAGAIDGIDFVLGGVQDVLSSQVLSHSLPMIGDGLADAAGFVQDLRTDVIQKLRDRFGESLNDTATVIQQALFEALGPDGLSFLLDGNADNSIAQDDIQVVFSDTDGDGSNDDQVDVVMLLGQQATLVDAPIGFDLGIPALGLSVDGNVQLSLGFQWNLAFGISRDDGFYLNVAAPAELALTLEARIPDLRAQGNPLFFQLDVTDEDADDNPLTIDQDLDQDGLAPSVFAATITVDLRNPIAPGDGKLRFADLAGGGFQPGDLIQPSIEGEAALNLDLLLGFAGDARFPSLGAELAVNWGFSAGANGLSGDVPGVAFNRVVLNAGEFVSDFADSVLREVKQVTDPLQPIVDFVTQPLPILTDFGIEITVLEIVEGLGYGDVASFVGALGEMITLINNVPIVTGEILIPLGSFDLTGTDPRAEEDLSKAEPHVTEQVDAPDQMKAAPEVGAFYTEMTEDDGLAISFPIIENPLNAFKLLLGQDVDLFLVDLPPLAVGLPFPIIKVGPIIPPIPIFVAMSGYISAGIDLKFGYDTRGLRKFLDTEDPWDVFAGFFISDRENADGTGQDVSEATLTGVLNAGAELSLVVASAGVSGGVAIHLNADFSDTNGDGKIHVDEFLGNLQRGLLSTFDVYGAVTAKLDAYVELLFVRYDYALAEFTLIDFELTDSDIYVDRFAGGAAAAPVPGAAASPASGACAAATPLGIAPGLHVDGLSLETHGDADCYEFELLRADSVDVDVRHSRARGDIDLEVYDAAGNLLGASRTDRDREIVSLIDVPAGKYDAQVFGRRNNYLFAVEPGAASPTRVIYVNPAGKDDRGDSYYTTMPGNDQWSGLLPRRPKATLQSVLETYELGPHDLIVLDTGRHAAGAVIAAADQGASYVGSRAGSYITGIHLDDSDGNRFESVIFAGAGIGMHIGAGSEGNVVRRNTFAGVETGVRIDSRLPNLVEQNRFLPPIPGDHIAGEAGVYLASEATATVRDNDVAGRATGIYSDSRAALLYGNAIHGNAVGMSSRRGILGPDNPPPVGGPGGLARNEIYDNGIGILVPPDATGVWVRFNEIYNNREAGIEQWGDASAIVANDVHHNLVGIRGGRVIGPDQWGSELHNLVHHNGVGIAAEPDTEVRYNHVFANGTGIRVADETFVHHNLIYRNTGHGVLVDGARQVRLVNNTIYAPAGNGVHLENFADTVTIRNNILYAESGYALYVAADSQFGYSSDYNNLYATGGGRVAFQGKDFDDVYDWQVETESDLHSIGRTDPDPALDDPRFVAPGGDDYRLRPGSTSIDAGHPGTDFSLEPGANGGRVNLGAYGNTPLAAAPPPSWLRIAAPNFYADLVPSLTYEIRWDTYNVPGTDAIEIALLGSHGTKLAEVAATFVSAGSVAWTPGQFVGGDPGLRYRIELKTSGATSLTARSREPFSVPDVVPVQAQTFYVNDRSQADDEYTTAIGNNRNTGTTADDPKEVIRPLVLSYPLGAGEIVRVDTGNYVHAVNLNLSGSFQAADPRMNTVERTRILGPTDPNRLAHIDRANPHPGAKTIDVIGAAELALQNLTLAGASTGLHVRDASDRFAGERLTIARHTEDGLDIEGHSDGATLDYLVVRDNGGHGVFVESRLVRIAHGEVYANEAIGLALRDVGAAVVETSRVYVNRTGIDIINPGVQQAVVGHADWDQQRGNLVYQNDEDGVFASGRVLVAGNTVAENGGIGIHLNDGADALRNVVRQHTSGIWGLGSESDIVENRSYANVDTGIAASFASRVARNVTYANGVYGIHVDWFTGAGEHNVVYDTGRHSIVVEGSGAGATVVNNTVYEPCADNRFEPSPGQTTIEIPWQWQILIERFPDPPGGIPGGLFPVLLSGTAQMRFGEPVGEITGDTFDLGLGGDAGSPTAEPVPPGQRWLIATELVALDLRSAFVPGLGEIGAVLQPSNPSLGSLVVEAVDMGFEEPILVGSSSLALNLDFVLPNDDQQLFSIQTMPVGMEFGFSAGLGPYDALRMSVPFVTAPGTPPAGLISALPPGHLWGQWYMESGSEGPRRQDGGQCCASAGIHVRNQSEYVLLRNNAVFVEGSQDVARHGVAHAIIVAADSTLGWNSDFNLLHTRYGAIGNWAGGSQGTLTDWQNASRDDYRSIDSDPDTVWVDPDGDDDRLGFAGLGLSDGRDDNLHLKSLHGHVLTGALAPVEQIVAVPPGLPAMQTVVWGADPRDVSPAVDWGDPRYPYGNEPAENGQMINLGAYGGTDQAARSEPYYIHLVYPLGREELAAGRTYDLQWRSRLPSVAGVNLAIELRHGNKDGTLRMTIDANVPNTDLSYLWTVPGSGIPRADDDVIVVRWPGDPADPDDDVVGEPRRQLTVDADGTAPDDTVPPLVRDVAPRFVHYGRSTKDDAVGRLSVEFSENLDAATAGSPASYELAEAGADGIFGTADDIAWTLTPAYAAGATDGDSARVDLDLGGSLPAGSYRLTVQSAAIRDLAGLPLDGDDDGAAGGDYSRRFTIDRTLPTVQITGVSPNVQNGEIPSVTIVFSEPVQGPGLADLRLTRDGGSNLLTGRQTLDSDDLVTWTLAGLDEITPVEGTYAVELASADSGIVDRAGNPLAIGAADGWATDTTHPTVRILPVAPDPRSWPVSEIAFIFSEPVLRVEWTDLVLRRDGGANLLSAANAVNSADGVVWTLSGLAALTAPEGSYALTIVADSFGVADLAANALAGDAREVWRMDVSPPRASIEAVLPDPRHAALPAMRIHFDEPVVGLDLGDLRLYRTGLGGRSDCLPVIPRRPADRLVRDRQPLDRGSDHVDARRLG